MPSATSATSSASKPCTSQCSSGSSSNVIRIRDKDEPKAARLLKPPKPHQPPQHPALLLGPAKKLTANNKNGKQQLSKCLLSTWRSHTTWHTAYCSWLVSNADVTDSNADVQVQEVLRPTCKSALLETLMAHEMLIPHIQQQLVTCS
jgi:hypothetical protein